MKYTYYVLGSFALVCCTVSSVVTYSFMKDCKAPIIINNVYNPAEIPEGVKVSKGIRNKNPLNVKYSKESPWKGQIGDDGTGFAVFKSWEYGVRAASFVLKNYAKKHNISTVEGIITRFSDTDQEEYIKFVCKNMNLERDESFNVVKRMPELLRLMSRFEELFAPYDVIHHL